MLFLVLHISYLLTHVPATSFVSVNTEERRQEWNGCRKRRCALGPNRTVSLTLRTGLLYPIKLQGLLPNYINLHAKRRSIED